MKNKLWLSAVAVIFAIGAGGVIYTRQTIESQSIEQPLTADASSIKVTPKTVPELIADQIQSGDISCPASDTLTYEACLLFQGALGTWQRVDMPYECPDVVGDKFEKSQLSPKPGRKLSPNDALRATKSACFGYLYAIAVANLTPIIISTSNRTFQMATDHKFIEPGSDATLCVIARHGICGNHAAVGQALFEKAGIEARPLEFYYEADGQRLSHIIVEAHIDGHWRPVDTTYGAYWPSSQLDQPFRLTSTEELLGKTEKKIGPTWNEALLPYGFYSSISKPNYFNYLEANADVIRGNAGDITLKIVSNKGSETFSNLPNFIGDNKADNKFNDLKFRLKSDKYKYRLTLDVLGSAFSTSDPVFICIDQSCEQYSKEKSEYIFNVQKPSSLYLKTKMDVAYVVVKSLDWSVVSN